MLFNSALPDLNGCMSSSDAPRLYYVALGLDGQAQGLATEIADITAALSPAPLITPSLSPNRCRLYFAPHVDSDFDIYEAHRR